MLDRLHPGQGGSATGMHGLKHLGSLTKLGTVAQACVCSKEGVPFPILHRYHMD